MPSIPGHPPRRHGPAATWPAAAVALALALAPHSASAGGVRGFDFLSYFRTQVADVCAESEEPAGITSLEYADLDGDGVEEAVLVGWDCVTGTAGPNIHAVYKVGRDGQPIPLPVDKRGRGRRELAGNTSYALHARNGELIREFIDGSGREHPLVEILRWDGKVFRVVRVEKARTYPTSFDCAGAATDAEITVCGSEELAALDRELAEAFAVARASATGEAREALVTAQRAWLADRDRRCTYKGIPECVRDAYRKRIDELASKPR